MEVMPRRVARQQAVSGRMDEAPNRAGKSARAGDCSVIGSPLPCQEKRSSPVPRLASTGLRVEPYGLLLGDEQRLDFGVGQLLLAVAAVDHQRGAARRHPDEMVAELEDF